MRLKKTKVTKNPIPLAAPTSTIRKAPLHNKNASMDLINKKSQEEGHSIYLNKILQKNLGMKRADADFPNFKENITNFQTSIQNILSNEESRQKAMRYVIGMRNKSRGASNASPFVIRNDYSRNVHETNNTNTNTNSNMFAKTINDGFYDQRQRKNNMYDNDNYNYRYNYERNLKTDLSVRPRNIVVTPYTGYNIYTNKLEPVTPDKAIRVNKVTRYYDEIPYQGETNIYVRNNLGTQSTGRSNSKNRNIQNNMVTYKNTTTANYASGSRFYNKKPYNDTAENLYMRNAPYNYNDNYDEGDDNEDNVEYLEDDDNNQFEPSSENSGMKEVIIDNLNEIYQSPKYNEEYNEDNKYSDNRKNIYKKEYNKPQIYSKKPNNTVIFNRYKYKNIGKTGKITPTPTTTSPPPSSFKNLKIEKNRFRIKPEYNKINIKPKVDYNSEIMEKIRDRFLDKLKQSSTNVLNIKGTPSLSIKGRKPEDDAEKNKIKTELTKVKGDLVSSQNKNKENENQLKTLQEIIQSLREIINTHKIEIESKNKEITELKKNTELKELKNQLKEYLDQITSLKETIKSLQEIRRKLKKT